jgi:hypothetical protein
LALLGKKTFLAAFTVNLMFEVYLSLWLLFGIFRGEVERRFGWLLWLVRLGSAVYAQDFAALTYQAAVIPLHDT